MHKQKRWQLKHWYKQYSDLPVEIIKQIIDFKIQNQPHGFHKKIQAIKNLNTKINTYEKALDSYSKYMYVMSQYPDVYVKNDVYVDYGEYTTHITQSDVVKEIQWLKQQKQKLINSCKYERRMSDD
jgi:hypothetical protein